MRRKIAVGAALLVLLVLAGWLRVDFLRSVNHDMSHDAVNYDAMARQLLEDGVYAYADTEPNAKVTPGYPLFLAAVYKLVDYEQHDPLPWVRYIQMLLSLASVWLIYRITRELSNDITGLLAALLAAVYPPFVWMNGAVLTETLGLCLLLSHLWVQLLVFRSPTKRLAGLAGVLLGLTVLVRPEFMPLLVVNYAFYWLWKRDLRTVWRLLVCTAVGLALVLLPWWVRNIVTLNEIVLTATQANPLKAGTYPYKNYEDDLIDPEGLTETEVAIARLKAGFSQQPLLYLRWYTVGKLHYIYDYVYAGGGYAPYHNVLPEPINPNTVHRTLIVAGLAAAAVILFRWRQPASLLIVHVAAMTAIRLVFVPEYRYNIMSMPLIIMIVCIAAFALLRWIMSRRNDQTNNIHGGDPDAQYPV